MNGGFRGHMRERGRRLITGVALSPEPTTTFTPDKLTPCRVSWVTTREVVNGSQVTPTSVEIRIPRAQTIRNTDRFMVTHRMGRRLAEPEVYAIVGEPRTTLAETVLDCQHIFGGSAL